MMSRGRWRIWSVCRRGWRGGGIISRRVRGGRNCWGKGWRRFGGFVKGSVEVSSGFSFDPVVVSFATANDNPPCRDEAAPRVGHPELWRSQLVIVRYRERHHHPVATESRRGWGTRSCGDLSLLSFATANDTTTLSR